MCGNSSNNNNSRDDGIATIRAILFDLDGTLLDTEALSDKALLCAFGASLPEHVQMERAAAGYRLPWELKKQILGLRGAEWYPIVIRFAQEHWEVPNSENATSDLPAPPPLEEFWKAWEESLNSFCSEIAACPGATELVQALAKQAPDVPMAIATSSRQASVDKKRTKHEAMFRHIKSIVPGDDPAVRKGKPAPDIYAEAARRLGVLPSECLVFEDALSGVRSGKAAGCFVVAVPDPRFSEEEKASFKAEADVVLDDLWQFDGKPWGLPVSMDALRNAQ